MSCCCPITKHSTTSTRAAGRSSLREPRAIHHQAAEDLGGNVLGMKRWSEVELESPGGGTVKVTAVHAQMARTAATTFKARCSSSYYLPQTAAISYSWRASCGGCRLALGVPSSQACGTGGAAVVGGSRS